MIKVKICGLTSPGDIAAVNEVLPEYVGFVFAESQRHVEACEAAKLRAALDERIVPVGVFVDAVIEEIVQLYAAGTIAVAQLHGCEDAEYIRALKARCDIPIIKAAVLAQGTGEHMSKKCTGLKLKAGSRPTRKDKLAGSKTCAARDGCDVRDTSDVCDGCDVRDACDAYGVCDAYDASTVSDVSSSEVLIDYLLFDYQKPGSGQRFDWSLLKGYKKPYFLAGGITEKNLAEALVLKPFCIDVSSGVETNGKKDREKIAAFVKKARQLQ